MCMYMTPSSRPQPACVCIHTILQASTFMCVCMPPFWVYACLFYMLAPFQASTFMCVHMSPPLQASASMLLFRFLPSCVCICSHFRTLPAYVCIHAPLGDSDSLLVRALLLPYLCVYTHFHFLCYLLTMPVNPLKLLPLCICLFSSGFCFFPCSCPTFSLCLLYLCVPLRVLPTHLQPSACFYMCMLLFRPMLANPTLRYSLSCVFHSLCVCIVHLWLLSVYKPS